MDKKDGIGQELRIGSVVVRCGFHQYAGVQLYKVVKESNKNVTIALLEKKVSEKVISVKSDRLGDEIRCSVDPSTLVDITELLLLQKYRFRIFHD